MEFVTGAHGDGYPFTSSTQLAHTFYPAPQNPEPIAGDMHFNDMESWDTGSGIDLFSLALHEAGHALGLGHSDNPNDVMYPYYKRVTGLSPGDISAIRASTPHEADPWRGFESVADNCAAARLHFSCGHFPEWDRVRRQRRRGNPMDYEPGCAGNSQRLDVVVSISCATGDGREHHNRDRKRRGRKQRQPIGSGDARLGHNASTPRKPSAAVSDDLVARFDQRWHLRFHDHRLGTAASTVGLAGITWTSSLGSGTTAGLASWNTGPIPLMIGMNTIVIYAADVTGKTAWRSLMVTRQ